MKKKLKIFDLVMLILVAAIFITISIIGFFPFVYWHTNDYETYYQGTWWFFGGLGFIAFALLIPIVVLTTRIFLNKSKDFKPIRIALASLYLLSSANYILVYFWDSVFVYYYYELSPNGVFSAILHWIVIFSCLTASIFNIYRAVKSPHYISEKKLKKIRTRESQQAVQKLRELKMLLDAGAIPQDVYEEKRKKYTDLI